MPVDTHCTQLGVAKFLDTAESGVIFHSGL